MFKKQDLNQKFCKKLFLLKEILRTLMLNIKIIKTPLISSIVYFKNSNIKIYSK